MRRRDFIRNMAPVAFLGGFKINALSHLPFMNGLQGATDNDHVLVLIQLIGGNDGLNTVIPLGEYGDYVGARSNIAIPQGKVLTLSKYPKTGLHPSLAGLKSLYDADKLAIIQAVGYPFPDGSHFRSTDIWLTGADSDKYLDTGWTGRFLADTYTNFPVGYPNEAMPDPLAIQIGSVISPVFMAQAGTTAMAVPTDTAFYDLINGITEPEPDTPMGNELTYLRAVARQTNKYADAIEAAAKKVTSQSPYPQGELAAQLKTVARLIAGGLKTRVYMVSMGGFDTHGGQVQGGDTTTGNHANLLRQLSDAIAAFMTDCQSLGVGQRVMGMTFSEFGRRIKSNGSFGTDHGAAQPVFIFGEYAATGVLGNNPTLAGIDDGANVQMQYDFRSVYSTLLRDWFCVPADDTTTMLLKNYQYLPFMKNTACGNTYDDLNNLGDKLISNSPNPFTEHTLIQFKTAGGHTLVQLFDSAGRLVMVPVDQEYTQGTYTVTVNTAALAAGVYYARLQNQSIQQVRTLLKVNR
ncbi:DUF1501 domain-containing protein [Flavitalea sp. BT771]|uniref:DUF1501 domain-containing protein n=1 Tax=Flavitalea sp. BT771 TaxID=3063329 RepID=UPI0026E19DA1|nr:DUF1501 domain-containing protein [Flavitalea sp. BT771]MDO6431609.1 DUF1501 domain-containing protein [Flavitalea sp. BT771]MDV6220517.1 DUF1501 domain-containing protein [Flavitalea sp. BT771]